jgi:hypothetical protein
MGAAEIQQQLGLAFLRRLAKIMNVTVLLHSN